VNLTGRWIGQTQGLSTPFHHWFIYQRGKNVHIFARWKEEGVINHFQGWAVKDEGRFHIHARGDVRVSLQNDYSFIVPGWVGRFDEPEDDEEHRTYDVVFYRRDRGWKKFGYNLWIRLFTYSYSLVAGL
jgi:hypothetical protein